MTESAQRSTPEPHACIHPCVAHQLIACITGTPQLIDDWPCPRSWEAAGLSEDARSPPDLQGSLAGNSVAAAAADAVGAVAPAKMGAR